MVAGELFHTGTPVVLWTDAGGYDAYRSERRFVDPGEESWEATRAAGAMGRSVPATPNRYGVRDRASLTNAEREAARHGAWTLATLRTVVDQFVIHYDVAGSSRACFQALHDVRGLSIHFMLDLDGTIYQTLDVKEKAWHATVVNDASVGIEIANVGAYARLDAAPLVRWYAPATWIDGSRDPDADLTPWRSGIGFGPGHQPAVLQPPLHGWAALGVREPWFDAFPARPAAVRGEIQGDTLYMYDLTCDQYAALIRLTAALCTALPSITCDVPRDAGGRIITHALPPSELRTYHGLLGHYHVQENKIDPGPAFQWEWVVQGARELMETGSMPGVHGAGHSAGGERASNAVYSK